MSDIEPATCPIEKLPNELLQTIFWEATSSKNWWDPCPLDLRAFPWVAGQVSRRWRGLALSFPQMWSDVKLRMMGGIRETGDASCCTGELRIALSSKAPEILEEYLLRSKNSSITVHIRSSNFSVSRSLASTHKVLEVLGGHSERWKSATVNIDNVSTQTLVFTQVNGRIPRLEKFYWCHEPLKSNPLPSAIVAPRLRELSLGEIPCTQSFPQWAQLQRIGLHNPTIEDLRVFQESHQLNHLHITGHFRDSPAQPDLKFSHLRILDCHPSMLKTFKELPALRELHPMGDGQEQLMTTKLFIQRLSLRLIAFTFPWSTSDDSSIVVDILRILPGLQTLNMQYLSGVMWKAAMDYLELDPERLDDLHLPELEHVEILTRRKPEIHHCIAMIESRFSVQSDFPRLKSIAWYSFPPMTLNDFPDNVKMRLEALGRRGLKVTHY
ncbi:hypothetical protein C8J56DRAFT_1021015 [Mycena floridula]|nr:hypothetical protein C8J56DRAFT_1021015 [Mycena floridula]